MRVNSKKAFGIDICKNAVSFVELRENNRQMEVVRAGCVHLDEAIVCKGVIQDPKALAKALKHSKIGGTFKHSEAVLTVCDEPILLQILNLPESSPEGAMKFIQSEVRQYAVLPLKNIEIDYCGLKSSDGQEKRVLVGAAKSEHLSLAINTIEKDNISTKAVEPAITAFIRACYDKVIRPVSNKNIMLLLIRDDTLNLCVFEEHRLEFLRIKKFETDIAVSEQRGGWLKSEVESVISFYELEKQTKAQGWRIIIACCPDNKYSTQIAGEIKSQIPQQHVEITAFENSMVNLVIDGNNKEEISPVAAGAAIKLLDEGPSGITMNLLPKEVVLVRRAKKEILIIVNVAACLLILLFMYIGLLSKKSIDISQYLYTTKQKQLNVNMLTLIGSKKDINEKAKFTENTLSAVQQAIKGRNYHDWSKILTELAETVPQTVLIQNLQGKGNDMIRIEGLAVDFESVSNFVSLLDKSKEMNSASLASVGQNTKSGNGLIDYAIVCFLKTATDFAPPGSR
jgi:Tfp pilus assembly PilM family ATPase/Tfp pilus assembly protein PilN